MSSHLSAQSGPFIVTVKRVVVDDVPDDSRDEIVSRLALATLEEAKAEAAGIVDACPGDVERQFYATAMLRGDEITTLPLPDGTVIEIEPVTRQRLWLDIRGFEHGFLPEEMAQQDDKLCAAFNAAQEAGHVG